MGNKRDKYDSDYYKDEIKSNSAKLNNNKAVKDAEDVIYTKEENKAALLAQINDIEKAYRNDEISFKDKTALISAIRFRLQDKFELERSDKERRIIVVPAKHLYVCPYTNRECSNMPPKEVCMKYYNLVEKNEEENDK